MGDGVYVREDLGGLAFGCVRADGRDDGPFVGLPVACGAVRVEVGGEGFLGVSVGRLG